MRIIFGKLQHSDCDESYSWLCDIKDIKMGEFAIVENKGSYAMVEVIGIADINEDDAKLVCGRKPYKKVIAKIERKTLDALSNGEKVELDVRKNNSLDNIILTTDKKKAKTTKKK